MANIKAFQNEEESIAIGELTAENRLDRISLYGSLQITRDKAGLKLALELKELIDAAVTALQAEKLPEHIAVAPSEKVDNPFK
jgi:hypothetical protein